MSMVKFATLCDQCGKRSEEYTAWPSCEGCGDEVCDDCGRVTKTGDGDRPDKAICKKCEKESGSSTAEGIVEKLIR